MNSWAQMFALVLPRGARTCQVLQLSRVLVLVSRYALRGSPRGVGVPRNVTTLGGAVEMKNGEA